MEKIFLKLFFVNPFLFKVGVARLGTPFLGGNDKKKPNF
jgi:hypothetical protein